jgi:hypothetical protein
VDVRAVVHQLHLLPTYKWVGLAQYQRLYDNDRWWVASKNLAVFGGMFIGITLVIGVTLAVFLDQRIRREGLYPHHLPVPDGAVDDRHRYRLEMAAQPRHGPGQAAARLGLGRLSAWTG